MSRSAPKLPKQPLDEGDRPSEGERRTSAAAGKNGARQPPPRAAEARRAAILAAALEEFTARGFEGARLDDVAKRAGIAKGTIYFYFADKETVFPELVR